MSMLQLGTHHIHECFPLGLDCHQQILQSSLRSIKEVPDDMQMIAETVNSLVRKVDHLQEKPSEFISRTTDAL